MKKLLIILGVLGTACSAIFVRYADAGPDALAFYRMVFAVVLIIPSLITKHRHEWKELSRKQFLLCLVSGVFLGMHFSFYFESLIYTSIASAVVLVDTEVFFVALGGFFLGRERLSFHGWIGIIVTFMGSLIIALGDAGGGSNLIKGDLIALAGTVCMSVYTLIGKTCRAHMSTTFYTGIVYFFAAATLLIKMLLTGVPIWGYADSDYLAALGLAVFCTLLGHSVYNWGLKYEKATFISTVKLLEPIFASVLGVFFFHEIPGVSSVVGGLIVIGGIVYYIRRGSMERNPAA